MQKQYIIAYGRHNKFTNVYFSAMMLSNIYMHTIFHFGARGTNFHIQIIELYFQRMLDQKHKASQQTINNK